MKSRLSTAMMRSHSSYICLVNLLGERSTLDSSRFWGGGEGQDGAYLIVGS
jgi:hypothetical protein